MTPRKYTLLGFGTVLLAAAAVNACGDRDSAPVLRPGVVLIDRSNQPLTVGVIQTINGTYGANCDGRSGAWTLPVTGGAAGGTNTLSILQGDTDCDLTLTQIVTDEPATYLALSTDTGTASGMPIPTTTYSLANLRAFATVAGQPPAFYGNAIRSAGDATSFGIEFTFSNDPNFDVTPTSVPPAATFTVTGSGVGVAAPSYTLELEPDGETRLAFETVSMVTTVVGQAVLEGTAPMGTTPVGYVVTREVLTPASTFPQVDAAFKAVAGVGNTSVASISAPILGTALTTLLADPEPVTEAAVIIAVADDDSGVITYQVIRLSFVVPDACTEAEAVAGGCTCGGEIVGGLCEIAIEDCVDGQDISTDNCDCDEAGGTLDGNICEILGECGPNQNVVSDPCICSSPRQIVEDTCETPG